MGIASRTEGAGRSVLTRLAGRRAGRRAVSHIVICRICDENIMMQLNV